MSRSVVNRPTMAASFAVRRLPIFGVLLFSALAPAAVWARSDPNGVAVIIGNRTYADKDIPEVSFAYRDAEAFKRYVLDVLGFDPKNVIELRDARLADLQGYFGDDENHRERLWGKLNPDEGSDVVVFYSGHGVPGLKDRRGYLLPSDARPDDAEDDGYPIDLLYANLGKLEKARSVTVYLDACFSGGSEAGTLIGEASPVYVKAKLPDAVKTRLTVLTAASAREVASWDKEAGHGLFTHHLLDALYGRGDGWSDGHKDGRVTAAEVMGYLVNYMTRAALDVHKRDQYATLLGAADTVLSRAADGLYPVRRLLGDVAVEKPPDAPRTTVEQDKYLLGMQLAHEAKDHGKVLEFWEKLAALGGETPAAAWYYRGTAYAGIGRAGEANEALHRYLEGVGKEGEHYRQALALALDLEETMAADEAAFEQAQAADTVAAYGEYLKAYPSGSHAAEARRLQAQAEARKDMLLLGMRNAYEAGAYGGTLKFIARLEELGEELPEEVSYYRAQAELRSTGRKFRDCPTCPEMVIVPAGSFMMGSPASESGRESNEGPTHRVTIGEPFAVGVYEITYDEWDYCVADGGCGGYRPRTLWDWGRGTLPVVGVGWEDAQAYVAWLSRKTGKMYRLLSESEWEYVARSATNTPYHFGDDISSGDANYEGFGGGWGSGRTTSVGTFRPNMFGLYDVHGNVWEWVQDCWNDNYVGAPGDASAWESGDCNRRMIRGGAWSNGPQHLRSAARYRYAWGLGNMRVVSLDQMIGFRVARTLGPARVSS